MRSAKATVPVIMAPVTDSEIVEKPRMPRLRKGARAPSQSLASVSSSANSSDAEAPASPAHGPKPETLQSRQSVVIDHQGAGKIVHKPDGTVVWEPATNCLEDDAPRRDALGPVKQALANVGMVVTLGSAAAGLLATQQHIRRAGPAYLSTKDYAGIVAHAVTGYLAGTATGMVLGPMLAARIVVGSLVRPALLGLLLHRGVTTIARWKGGVMGLLRKLQSTDPSRVLEALRAIIAAARRNPRFAREFNKLAGIEALLQRLAAAMPDCPLLHLLVQALAELCKDQECRDSLVAAGGVPRLVALLGHSNPAVSSHCLTALASLADHAVALEAIREAGGVHRLVQLTATAVALQPPLAVGASGPATVGITLSSRPSSPGAAAGGVATGPGGVFDRRAVLLPAVKLLQALSLDPASKAAIGAAGGVATLLDVISHSEPRSEAQSEAIAALHSSLRGCPENQRTLAALPAASEVLRGALGGFGPCWHPAKGDLHALLNVLARLQGVQEAGGFVVIQSQVAAAAARDAAVSSAGGSTAASAASKA